MQHHVGWVWVASEENARHVASDLLEQLSVPEFAGWREYDACRWDDVFLDGASSVVASVENVRTLDLSFAPSFLVMPDMYYDFRVHRPWTGIVREALETHKDGFLVLYLVVTETPVSVLAS